MAKPTALDCIFIILVIFIILTKSYSSDMKNEKDFLLELDDNPEIPLKNLRPKIPSSLMELACRNHLAPPSRRNLFCSYNSTTTPFLRLAPFKTEQISLDPVIFLFHDVIYDSEISFFTKAKSKEMRDALTDNYTMSKLDSRIMQVKLYEGNGDKMDKALLNRLEDISGLDVGNKSIFAAGNYGLGSYFPIHSDYRNLEISTELNMTGNRLATILFYLTDVPQGGQTIFPLANIIARPKKGSALFWYNLHNNGEPNKLSLHGVCPIIEGNRWILTTALLEWNQMFRKPCYK